MMSKTNYLDALKAIEKKDYPCYVFTGKEPYQKNKLIKLVSQKYKAKNFEFLSTQIINQQYEFLQRNFNSFSLFSDQRLLQFNINTAPDKNSQKLLANCLCNISKSDRFLLVFDDLTACQQKAKWFQAIIQNALYVQVRTVSINEATRLIKLELANFDKPITLTEDALMLLAQKTEGNLFAANQIIKILQHQPQNHYNSALLSEYLIHAVKYVVFDLSQSLIEQNLTRSLTILEHLLKEEVESAIILWAILKEIRTCFKLSLQNSQEQQQTYEHNNIWKTRQAAYARLSKKFSKSDYAQIFNKCFSIDLIIKGIESGNQEQKLTELICQLH